jgi:GTP-binding protein
MSVAIRNIAIIAHVDHGKTTLVDKLLRQSGTFDQRAELVERVMDSNDLEKERGITILAKNTAINWKGTKINIVDTPGHADFGGEVERIMSMVDSVLLLVDAVDGPMPQTRFVTEKAFRAGLNPILVINKVDRPGARPDWVIDQVFDLFDNLGANEKQLDFPVVYASALEGFATLDLDTPSDTMAPLLDFIVEKVPAPTIDEEGPLQMQIVFLDYSSYLGVIGVGRVTRGTLRAGANVCVLDRHGNKRNGKIANAYLHLGLERIPVETAGCGDIAAVTGIEGLTISETICDREHPEMLPPLTVDEPTISMMFVINTSPFVGKEGKFVTSRQLRERLFKEMIYNIGLKIEDTDEADKFKVSGRGELQLSIFIETIRREGFELAVSRPTVIFKEIDGVRQEPYESLVVDVQEEHQGTVMERLGERRGQIKNMLPDNKGRVKLEYEISSRGLIGFHGEFMSMTSGMGIIAHVFSHYGPISQAINAGRKNGVLISMSKGKASGFALWNLQPRGRLFIGPQTEVYEGMIVGIHSRDNDLVVNVTKEKQLTNMRASGTDENIVLTTPLPLTLEYAIEFIDDDELVEITPKSIRLRKKSLSESERKKDSRTKD